MEKIKLKDDLPEIELNGELLMKAYNDAKSAVYRGSKKCEITMGKVLIRNKERFLKIIISDELRL